MAVGRGDHPHGTDLLRPDAALADPAADEGTADLQLLGGLGDGVEWLLFHVAIVAGLQPGGKTERPSIPPHRWQLTITLSRVLPSGVHSPNTSHLATMVSIPLQQPSTGNDFSVHSPQWMQSSKRVCGRDMGEQPAVVDCVSA